MWFGKGNASTTSSPSSVLKRARSFFVSHCASVESSIRRGGRGVHQITTCCSLGVVVYIGYCHGLHADVYADMPLRLGYFSSSFVPLLSGSCLRPPLRFLSSVSIVPFFSFPSTRPGLSTLYSLRPALPLWRKSREPPVRSTTISRVLWRPRCFAAAACWG